LSRLFEEVWRESRAENTDNLAEILREGRSINRGVLELDKIRNLGRRIARDYFKYILSKIEDDFEGFNITKDDDLDSYFDEVELINYLCDELNDMDLKYLDNYHFYEKYLYAVAVEVFRKAKKNFIEKRLTTHALQ